MIGNALKKLAREKGMQIAKGVAYGSLDGFAATLSEGAGYKQIVFTTRFTDPGKKAELLDLINRTELTKTYRVQTLELLPNAVRVVFLDNPGTMKKITAFLDWFLPLLREHGAARVSVCTECGCEITTGRWVLINGTAYHFHDSCADKAAREVEGSNSRKAEADGSYITGLLGALCGSAVGAIVWGIVLYLGYVASLVGLLIGFLAEKGYNLLKGKQGKAKVPVLILAVIFGVVLGTVGAYGYALLEMIQGGELPGFVLGDIPMLLTVMLSEDPEFRSSVISNMAQGLLFAALGVFALLRQAGKAVADETFVELK